MSKGGNIKISRCNQWEFVRVIRLPNISSWELFHHNPHHMILRGRQGQLPSQTHSASSSLSGKLTKPLPEKVKTWVCIAELLVQFLSYKSNHQSRLKSILVCGYLRMFSIDNSYWQWQVILLIVMVSHDPPKWSLGWTPSAKTSPSCGGIFQQERPSMNGQREIIYCSLFTKLAGILQED